jgi:hypothetical protein
MTSLALNSKPSKLRFVSFVLPSYGFALTSLVKLWRPVGIGALVIASLALVPKDFLPIPTETTNWTLAFFGQSLVLLLALILGL